jgi:threonine dehydratase
MDPVTHTDIERAATQLKGSVVRAALQHSRTLSEITGAEIWLKFENHQFTASFKERGALNRLLTMDSGQRDRGVIAMSAGNHAQGLAYHCRRLGIPATIVMPEYTPFVKVRQTRSHGARVELAGSTVAESYDVAARLQEERGLEFVHPYDDPYVIAGQGTVALEMMEDCPALDAIVIPIGGGGLAAGCAIATRTKKPNLQIYGVQTRAYPFAWRQFKGVEEPMRGDPSPGTIAEGIAVKRPGTITMPIIQELVDDILLVSESDIEKSVNLLASIEKTVVEGAGAAGLAALLDSEHRAVFQGRKVGLILCGGNIDERVLAFIMLRSLARDGRLVRIRIEMQDRPGELARISTLVAQQGGNIVDVSHQRVFSALSVRSAELDLTVETRDSDHQNLLLKSILEAGFDARLISIDRSQPEL